MSFQKNSMGKNKKTKPFYYFWYDFVKITGAIPALIWLRPKVHYPYGKKKIPSGALLVCSNHITFFDPIIILVSIPWRRLDFLATKDLYSTRLRALMFSKMRCIQVDKENFTVSAFHDVVERLEMGRAVVIFPEGQLNRGSDSTMLAFKSGAALMASKAHAPILPMYIVKNKKWYNRQHVVMGEPIYVECEEGKMPSLEQLNRASESLREKELALREYFESLPLFKKKINKNIKIEDTQNEERDVKAYDEQKV